LLRLLAGSRRIDPISFNTQQLPLTGGDVGVVASDAFIVDGPVEEAVRVCPGAYAGRHRAGAGPFSGSNRSILLVGMPLPRAQPARCSAFISFLLEEQTFIYLRT